MRNLLRRARLFRKLLITGIGVFCGAYLSSTSVAQANLLANGSFESPPPGATNGLHQF
jgi:hypothetical protein